MRVIQLGKVILMSGVLIGIIFMNPYLSSAKLDVEAVLGVWFFDEGKGVRQKMHPKMAMTEKLLISSGSMASLTKP